MATFIGTRPISIFLICEEKPKFSHYELYVACNVQLVRQIQGQEENPFGDEATTPKKIFQLLNQVPFVVKEVRLFS